MTDPEALLREGRLEECLAALTDQVKKKPGDSALRAFLFQLLCVMGRWERAIQQGDALAEMDPQAIMMARVYQQAAQAEKFRATVFAGKRSPLIMGEPEPWIGKLIQAMVHEAQGEHDAGAALRDEAFEEAPATAGSIYVGPSAEKTEAHTFQWLADADLRLGPMFEVILEGKYYWAPWSRVETVEFEAPSTLRDSVWAQANFKWTNGGAAAGLVPVRYPGSEDPARDPAVRTARRTEFVDDPPAVFGQRLLATDVGEFGLLETRRIALGTAHG